MVDWNSLGHLKRESEYIGISVKGCRGVNRQIGCPEWEQRGDVKADDWLWPRIPKERRRRLAVVEEGWYDKFEQSYYRYQKLKKKQKLNYEIEHFR